MATRGESEGIHSMCACVGSVRASMRRVQLLGSVRSRCPHQTGCRSSATEPTFEPCHSPSWTTCCGGTTNQCSSEEHTSELQSLMRISYAVFCLKQHQDDHPKDKPNSQMREYLKQNK